MAVKEKDQQENIQDLLAKVEAISRVQAVIEFELDGTIITANDNFLNAMGYTLEEIQGKHHSMFAETDYAQSAEYKEFWHKLNLGEFDSGEYKRFGKHGKEVWIRASYNPIFDANGKPLRVVKYASDVTEEKLHNAGFEGQIDAIGKSQAVISFNMDGTIIDTDDIKFVARFELVVSVGDHEVSIRQTIEDLDVARHTQTGADLDLLHGSIIAFTDDTHHILPVSHRQHRRFGGHHGFAFIAQYIDLHQ